MTTIDEHLRRLRSEAFKLEQQLVAGQKKLLHIAGQIAALEQVQRGELTADAPQDWADEGQEGAKP